MDTVHTVANKIECRTCAPADIHLRRNAVEIFFPGPRPSESYDLFIRQWVDIAGAAHIDYLLDYKLRTKRTNNSPHVADEEYNANCLILSSDGLLRCSRNAEQLKERNKMAHDDFFELVASGDAWELATSRCGFSFCMFMYSFFGRPNSFAHCAALTNALTALDYIGKILITLVEPLGSLGLAEKRKEKKWPMSTTCVCVCARCALWLHYGSSNSFIHRCLFMLNAHQCELPLCSGNWEFYSNWIKSKWMRVACPSPSQMLWPKRLKIFIICLFAGSFVTNTRA